jgi:hypothetical protein
MNPAAVGAEHRAYGSQRISRAVFCQQAAADEKPHLHDSASTRIVLRNLVLPAQANP